MPEYKITLSANSVEIFVQADSEEEAKDKVWAHDNDETFLYAFDIESVEIVE